MKIKNYVFIYTLISRFLSPSLSWRRNQTYLVHPSRCLMQCRYLIIYVNWANDTINIYCSIINYSVLYFRNLAFWETFLPEHSCCYTSFCLCQECKTWLPFALTESQDCAHSKAALNQTTSPQWLTHAAIWIR